MDPVTRGYSSASCLMLGRYLAGDSVEPLLGGKLSGTDPVVQMNNIIRFDLWSISPDVMQTLYDLFLSEPGRDNKDCRSVG